MVTRHQEMSDKIIIGKFSAFLFDMDGTLVNSKISGERVWAKWAEANGLDVEKFIPTIHGVRSVDTIANLKLPGINAAVEAAKITAGEIADTEGVVAISGAIKFLNTLPRSRWAIVTSAPRALARARLASAGIAMPDLIVSAEDVFQGKPSPDGYLLASKELGVNIKECLVFEDVPVGIQAGESAGASVLVITAMHQHELFVSKLSRKDYENLSVSVQADGRLELQSRGT